MKYRLDGSKSSLGKSSRQKLSSVNADLEYVIIEASKWMNISVLDGHRGMERQNLLFEQGASRLKYPASRHNLYPSHAVDVAPYNSEIKGIDWEDIEGFKDMIRLIKIIASTMGLEITCGGDWESFKDYPHIELKK